MINLIRRVVPLVVLSLAIAILTPFTANAAPSTVQDRMNDALTSWMSANKINNAGMAVMRDNELVGSYGHNGMSAESPAQVASLSKAITAVCVMTLVDDGRLRLGSRLYSLSPSFDEAVDIAHAAPGAKDITIEALLRHRSRLTVDPTVGPGSGMPNEDASIAVLAARALKAPLSTMPLSESYNNANYAILAVVIESVTHESYESYCSRVVLAPRGANGRIGPGTRAMGPFGGWELSAVDYAMFARAYDPRSGLLSPAAHDFISAKMNPNSPTASLGMFVVKTNSGRNLFHHGSWRSTATTPGQFAAFYAMWDNGIAVAMTTDQELTPDQQNSLDNTLRKAAYSTA